MTTAAKTGHDKPTAVDPGLGLCVDPVKVLADHLGDSDWPFSACGMASDDILICDAEIRDILSGSAAKRQIQLVVGDELSDETASAAARIFVLLRKGEVAEVRRLKRRFGEATIISVTYGDQVQIARLSDALKPIDLTILVGSSCCGAPYLTRLIADNNLATAMDLANGDEAAWALCQHDFNPVRLALAKMTDATGAVVLHVGLGLLENFRIRSLLSHLKLKLFIKRMDAQVLYMQRRNKADQAAMLALAARRKSGLSLPFVCGVSAINVGERPDFEGIRQIAFAILEQEIRFERFLTNLDDIKVIAFEELLENPVDLIKMVSGSLGHGIPKKITILDPKEYQLQTAWADQNRAEFKNTMLDYLGISKNKHGSFATQTELLALE